MFIICLSIERQTIASIFIYKKTLEQLFDLEEPVEQTCPENHPFNYQDGVMCCAVQPNVEGDCPQGAGGSNCNTHYPDSGLHKCADHPTAVRVEGNLILVSYKGDRSKVHRTIKFI